MKTLKKAMSPCLRIRIHGIDGSLDTFTLTEPALIDRTLNELNPALVFTQDTIAVADADSQAAFLPPLLTRIDLITDRLSVWRQAGSGASRVHPLIAAS
jgi:hypothetical protein